MLSLLLHPQDIGLSENSSNKDAELNDRGALYSRVENAILDMGKFFSSKLFYPFVDKFLSLQIILKFLHHSMQDSTKFGS